MPNNSSISPIRATKNDVVELVSRIAPDYLEILKDCKDVETWRTLVRNFTAARIRLRIDSYVHLYEDELRIASALINALMSPEEQAEFLEEFSAASPEEQQETLHDFVTPGGIGDQISADLFPEDEASQKAQIDAFQSLDQKEKNEAVKRGQFLLGFFLAWFHQALAVMIHGEKMTSLVPKAIAGDEESFLKAIHIDKSLLDLHPALKAIQVKAIEDGNSIFLSKIAYRQYSPVTQGRIQLAGIFIVFSLLESLDWINDMRHSEILDICDAANLDRWHNRIEDEVAVSKALRKYRRYQKTSGLSMH